MFGDSDDPHSEVSKILATKKVDVLYPELNLKTSVFYVGLPKAFVAGTAVFGDTDEFAGAVRVTLEDPSASKTLTTATNNYGDFEFENLMPKKEYLVKLESDGYLTASVDVQLEEDTYLGQITLTKMTLASENETAHQTHRLTLQRLARFFDPCWTFGATVASELLVCTWRDLR